MFTDENGQRSVVTDKRNGQELDTHQGKVLDCNQFVDVWVRWTQGDFFVSRTSWSFFIVLRTSSHLGRFLCWHKKTRVLILLMSNHPPLHGLIASVHAVNVKVHCPSPTPYPFLHLLCILTELMTVAV